MRVSKNGRPSSISPSKTCKPRAMCNVRVFLSGLTTPFQSSIEFQTRSPTGKSRTSMIFCNKNTTSDLSLPISWLYTNISFGHQVLQREIASARGVPLGQPLVYQQFSPVEEPFEPEDKASPPFKVEDPNKLGPTGKRKYRRHPKVFTPTNVVKHEWY